MAKRQREMRLLERRAEKKAKKAARREAAAEPPPEAGDVWGEPAIEPDEEAPATES